MAPFIPNYGYNGPGGATVQTNVNDLIAGARARRAAEAARRTERADRNLMAGETRFAGARDAIDNIINKGYIDQAQADKAAGRFSNVLGNSQQQIEALRQMQADGLLSPEDMQTFMDQLGLANAEVDEWGEGGGVDQSNYDFATGNMRDSMGSLNRVRDEGMYTGEEKQDILANTYRQINDAGKAAAGQFQSTPGGSGILGAAGAASALQKAATMAGQGRADAYGNIAKQQAQSRWDAANDSVRAGGALGDLAIRYGEGQREGARIKAGLTDTLGNFLLRNAEGKIDAAGLIDSMIGRQGGFANDLAGIDMSTMPAWLQDYLQDKINDESGAEGQMNSGSGWKDKRTVKKSPTSGLDFDGYPDTGPIAMGGAQPSRPAPRPGTPVTPLPGPAPAAGPMIPSGGAISGSSSSLPAPQPVGSMFTGPSATKARPLPTAGGMPMTNQPQKRKQTANAPISMWRAA